jgi:hypothetical protein
MLLLAARRAFAVGRARAALELLGDELLAHDCRAQAMLRDVEQACEALAAQEVPAETGVSPTSREALRELLARLREPVQADAGANPGRPADARSPDAEPAGPAPSASPAPENRRAVNFLLALDNAGTFLVAAGRELALGHSRARRADLGFLADVAPLHARLSFSQETFHSAAAWSIAPLGSESVWVNGRPVPPEGRALLDGERIQLSKNLALRFRSVDPASSSAVLELEGGLECSGAQRVLLLVEGPAGRVRIGPGEHRTIRAPAQNPELELELERDELRLTCEQGLLPEGASNASRTCAVRCPPASGQHVRIGAFGTPGGPQASSPPVWLTLSPPDAL